MKFTCSFCEQYFNTKKINAYCNWIEGVWCCEKCKVEKELTGYNKYRICCACDADLDSYTGYKTYGNKDYCEFCFPNSPERVVGATQIDTINAIISFLECLKVDDDLRNKFFKAN